ncbi:hypothetical protein D7322_23180 [Sphingobacterium puteale]|uniref:Uncharacterized protein n=1 Tax=Sphingobacterium puteale TaxID=2420510 RepID=A0A420VS24_9SPHI|nr:NUDIX domain-containing protein [Sphingobacterium puteale]RKO69141.1 hypothetical protein D7322_23180 [Sphingobacterium puteale]
MILIIIHLSEQSFKEKIFISAKIETEESKEDCLRREIKEEINIDITIRRSLTMVEHQHSDFSLQPFRMQSTIWKSKSAGACSGNMGRDRSTA